MKKKLLLLTAISLISLSSLKSQTMSNLVFESAITPTTTTVSLTFDFDGVSEGDKFEWQLIIAKADGTPDWGQRNIAYETAITPINSGSGTQTVTFGIYNNPVDGEVFTWAGKITLASDGSDTGYNNSGNLVTISNTASVDEVAQNKITMYPNPSSDILNISNKNLDIKSISIFSLIGKKVMEFESNDKELISVDISKLSKGIYLVSTGDKKIAKFLKE
ncbi:T9SS type A sorting domain-containing protein [uncultured Polaribacter sp.]|uniref:T9SS type A sorting domain-containing protein n=1 Tax=uncultured Polaribacter sp. TaxID=174711 RepID=UPI002638E741|nr:T9SS type A sorting domain-containing protein [uncultured Polaribacter sp.]